MNRARTKQLVIGVVVVLALIQFVPVNRTNPPSIASRSLEAHEHVPADVLQVMKRSCYNCHSNETVWPWYSHVAPVSWYVARDVKVARGHVNLQDWEAQINPKEGKEHLGLICKLVREGKMPPADYRFIHKEAELSATEINSVCAWSQTFGSDEDSDKKPE
jgi:hypothetical protein